MSEYKFTKDWFSNAVQIWEQIFAQLPEKKMLLEVGSYEGRSSCWLVENALEDGGVLYCLDTWEGGEEHKAAGDNMGSVRERFESNITEIRKQFPLRSVMSVAGESYVSLASFIASGSSGKFDFIYIDGSHQAADVLADACMAFGLLKIGGVMVFDDYLWSPQIDLIRRPKAAIDAFVNLFCERLLVISTGYQLAIQRVR